jgi:tetratricopeptide (TPR) repeat protein
MALEPMGSAQPATPPTPQQREQARQLFTSASRKFNLGKFAESAREFEQVYELIGDPNLLFNIAQAYRFDKNHERAIFFYKNYLRTDPRNRSEIEKRIADESALLESEQKSREAPPTGIKEPGQPPSGPSPTVPGAAPTQPAPTAPKGPSPVVLRYAGVGVGAFAVAALVVGGTMSGLAASASNDVENAATDSAGTQLFNSSLQKKESNGKAYDSAAIALYVMGGAAAGTAAALLILSMRKPSSSHAQLQPLIGPELAGLALSGSF